VCKNRITIIGATLETFSEGAKIVSAAQSLIINILNYNLIKNILGGIRIKLVGLVPPSPPP